MKTTSHSVSQIGTIDKVLFALFFTFYVAVIVVTSAVLTGCAPADQTVIGGALEEEVSADSKQDAGELKGATNITGQSGNTTDSVSSRNGPNSASDTKGGMRTVGDSNGASGRLTDSSSNGSSTSDGGNNLADNGVNNNSNDNDSSDESDANDTDSADNSNNDSGTSIGIDGKIIVGVQDIQSSDIKASIIQDTTLADIKGSVPDTKGTGITDITTSSDTSVGTGQKPDVITITQDVFTTVKDTITDIIKDTSAGIILDIIASASDTGSTTIKDGSAQADTKVATDTKSTSDISAVPDSQIVKDTSAAQDAQIWYDTQIAKDTQSAKDAQAQQDTQNQQDTQIQPAPDVFIAPNNQTTWYTSKEYKYKVQYPSWVQATVLKTTDLQLTGNVLNKVGLTDEKLLGVGHFTLRTEFEYHPEYAAPYDEWWKYLYGKPDETATYQGQTLKFQSIDGGAGFNRFTHVKIGKVGALRIEMSFYMPPHLYVEGFEQKALEVLYMVTKSAQAAN